MKQIILANVLIAIVSAASAAPVAHIGGGIHGGRTVIIYNNGFYNPWYSPYNAFYGYPAVPILQQPTKLEMQIQSIKDDYSDKISSVKSDKTLTRQERREKVKSFERERDSAVNQAKVDYYKS